MKKTINIFWVILLISIGNVSCQSKKSNNQETQDCPNIPTLIGRVNDYAEILSPEQEKELTSNLKSLETDIGSQVVILTIDSLGGEWIEEYSLRVANCWGIGRKSYNDGILITVALNDRKMRIEVGYGLEKIVKDHIAKNIIVNDMVPFFKKEAYFNGLLSATNKIDSLIRANPELVGEQP